MLKLNLPKPNKFVAPTIKFSYDHFDYFVKEEIKTLTINGYEVKIFKQTTKLKHEAYSPTQTNYIVEYNSDNFECGKTLDEAINRTVDKVVATLS